MARGMPRAQEWMTQTALSENRCRCGRWARWARRYPSASAAVTAGEGMTSGLHSLVQGRHVTDAQASSEGGLADEQDGQRGA